MAEAANDGSVVTAAISAFAAGVMPFAPPMTAAVWSRLLGPANALKVLRTVRYFLRDARACFEALFVGKGNFGGALVPLRRCTKGHVNVRARRLVVDYLVRLFIYDFDLRAV